MTSDDLYELRQFFGAYFHQDWAIDASAPDEVVRLFIDDTRSAGRVAGLADQMERFAADGSGDAEVERRLFHELGCYYMPSADGLGAAAWLRHVAALLKAA